jgi:hypothetical protein
MRFGIHQQVFMLFFAIFWGAIANVQPRWKAFNYPLIFRLRHVFRRILVALVVLNVLPIVYFGFILWWTRESGPAPTDSAVMAILKVLIGGIIPAFAIFGFYRLWLGIVELRPWLFYKSDPTDLPSECQHVEPTYRHRVDARTTPVVDLEDHAGIGNLIAAVAYVVVGWVGVTLG